MGAVIITIVLVVIAGALCYAGYRIGTVVWKLYRSPNREEILELMEGLRARREIVTAAHKAERDLLTEHRRAILSLLDTHKYRSDLDDFLGYD